MSALLIQNGTLVTLSMQSKADVLVRDGIIAKLVFHDSPDYAIPSIPDLQLDESIDASGLLLFPGLIDCHVHFREPGLTHKATMRSEAAAARAGGVTTVCEMPNTIPPTVTVMALADKVRRSVEIGDCDCRFFFGATEISHLQALCELWTGTSSELVRLRRSCCGLKLFLDHSTGNQKASMEVVEEAFRLCGEHKIPLVCHCEDATMNAALAAANTRTDIAAHSGLRPAASEAKAVAFAIELARKTHAPLHIAHLSTADALDLVRQAKAEKISVTCEVAPHHLFLTIEDYETLGSLGKMNPPLRSLTDCDALWRGIEDGTVDCIATDHAPHTLEEKKEANPLSAPSGVPGVETMIPLLLSVAGGQWPSGEKITKDQALITKFGYQDILRLCFENPNRIFGLGKNGIIEGAPADLVLADPAKEWMIHGRELHSKCGWTPFEDWQVRGAIVRVIRP